MFNPRPVLQYVPIGEGRHCVVIDDLLNEPHKLVELAVARRAAFALSPANCYPGIEHGLTDEFNARFEEFFAQHLRRSFDARRTMGSMSRMSIVTLRPEQLGPLQRICHRDIKPCEPTEGACASVMYLFDDARLGGTSFYRPLMSPDRIDHLLSLAKVIDGAAFGKIIGAAPAYFNGDGVYFEKTATIAPAWNRALFYDATAFHSGQIDHPELLDADPAKGRLTVNAFLGYRKKVN